MVWTRRPAWRTRPHRPRRRAVPRIEALEARALLAAPGGSGFPPPLVETEPNDVLTQAVDLGTVDVVPAAVAGDVGNGPYGVADVDGYQFEVAAPAHVTLTTRDGAAGGPLVGALSLYEADPLNFILT